MRMRLPHRQTLLGAFGRFRAIRSGIYSGVRPEDRQKRLLTVVDRVNGRSLARYSLN
jgi:hypothetical protein